MLFVVSTGSSSVDVIDSLSRSETLVELIVI